MPRKGGTNSPEQRAKISATLTGRTASPETRAAMSASHTGKPHPRPRKSKEEELARSREWKRANKGRISESNKDYYRRRGQFVIRMREYGLTQEHFEAMLETQGNACLICGLQFREAKATAPHVDHDHATGRVRALLCVNCNFLVGYCREDVAVLLSAARYLESQKEIAKWR